MIFAQKELFVSMAQAFDILIVEASSLQANEIQAADSTGIAIDNHVWRNVLDDLRTAANHRVDSNAAKLMNCCKTRDDGIICDFDMPAEGAVVGKNNMIADLTVVGDVRVAEQ